LPAVGGEPYQLTFGEWDHFEPRWSPDGEWIVYVSNQHGLSDLRVLRTFGGDERRIEIHKRVYLRPMGKVEVTIRDLSANAVTPARMYARAADGKTYAPVDSFQRISPRTNQYFFHMAGKSTLEVPAGRLELEATKGFEFWTKAQTIEVKAGEVTRVELGLERLANLKAEGWYNGSNHIHMNYGGNLHNTPENMMFMAAAEDNDVVGDQICNKDNRVFDRQFFTGAPDPRSTPDRLLYFNQEYRPPFYGHVSLINLTRNLISPFTTGYEGTAIESLYPSNTDMFRLAREQGAIGGYVHPWFGDPVKSKYAGARGFPVDLALGTTEYLEVLPSATGSNWAADVWHRALNCGFRITGTGGEDSISSLHRTAIVGSDRTYAYLGNQLNYATWIQAFRAGRTFFSNGPLLDFRMDLNRPGAEIRLPAEGGTIELYGRVQSVAPVEKFEVVNNGQVIESVAVPSPGNAAEIRKSISVSKSGWYTLRAMGSKAKRPVDDEFPFAETSPIYVYCGNQTIRSRADAEYFIRWIDEITRQAEEHPGWRSDAEKKSVLAQFATARKEFEKRASEAK
jgi:TolB protein